MGSQSQTAFASDPDALEDSACADIADPHVSCTEPLTLVETVPTTNSAGVHYFPHDTTTIHDPLADALSLATAGVPVFPCSDDKRPLTPNGFKDATSDPDAVRDWWRQHPAALPGVPMGPASGLFAVDLDVAKDTGAGVGAATFNGLGLSVDDVRFRARTPSGGAHLFYRWSAELPKNGVKVLPGIDIRTEGGYVIAWAPAAIVAAAEAESLEEPPATLLAAIAQARAAGDCRAPDGGTAERDTVRASAWAQQALVDETAELAAAPDGTRNDAVNRCAFNLGQIVGAGHLDRDQVEAAIWDAAVANHVACAEPDETRRTLMSGLEAGMAEPRGPKAAGCASSAPAEGLPSGFQLRADGVYRLDDPKSDAATWVWLCSYLNVVALTRALDGNGWGRLVELADEDGLVKRWAIPARMFAGDGTEVRAGLLDRGLQLASGARARHSLQDLLLQWRPDARATTTERLGWTDERCTAFALGDSDVLGGDLIVYQHEQAPPAAAELRAAGTLDGWREEVAARCVGNPLMVLSVSLAFAGPLLEPLNADSFGIHLRGPSSCGKSTIQRVAVSVWGSPQFMFTWRATSNGLEGIAAACNSTCLTLDELGEIDGREAGNAVYMLGNSAGKARATKAGHARAIARWRLPVLSSGEISLADKLAEVGKQAKAGQDVRLLDLAAAGFEHGAFADLHGEPDGAAFSNSMRNAAAEHFGVAGRVFVEGLLSDRAATLATVRDAVEQFRGLAEGRLGVPLQDGQTTRAVGRFALIAAAGEIATHLGLTCWPEGEATEAALIALELWLEGRGGTGQSEARDAIERVRAFVTAHGKSRFEPIGTDTVGDGQRPVHNRAGWVDRDYFYIAGSAWAEIHAGADPKRAARHLAEAGFLDGEGAGRHTRKAPREVPERPRCYWVKAAIMGDEAQHDDA